MVSPLGSFARALPIGQPPPATDPELAVTLDVLAACRDLGSSSDEPFLRSSTLEQRFNFHPGRANLIRALNIDPGWNILELSPGYGSLTRYLGERCATVDAVEPVPARACITRARTADLSRVGVYVGDLHRVPAVPFYDLILVNALPEFAGAGVADAARCVEFVSDVAERLAPGGAVVLGIDNRAGVRHLVRTPESLSQRSFTSTGYSAARTFTRAELAGILSRSGLQHRALGCFPDHRIPRFIFDATVLCTAAPELAAGIPEFPSANWGEERADLAGERSAWKTVVEAGLAEEMVDSFVVIASPSTGPRLWDSDLAGIFFSSNRRSEFGCRTRIEVDGDKVMLRRSRTSERPQRGEFTVEPHDADFVPGVDLVDVLVDVDDPASLHYLTEWAQMVRTCRSREVPYDLIPQNMVVASDGHLCAIDDEWRAFGQPAANVLTRGVLLLGQELANGRSLAGDWAGCRTFRDVVIALGAAIGLDSSGSWIESAVVEEARFRSAVSLAGELRGPSDIRADTAERLYSFLTLDLPGGDPLAGTGVLKQRAADVDRLRAESAQSAELAAVAGQLVLAGESRCAALMQELRACRQELRESKELLKSQELRRSVVLLNNHEVLNDHELPTNTEILNARAAVERADQEVARMQQTVSWRATTALRWVRSKVLPRRAGPGGSGQRSFG